MNNEITAKEFIIANLTKLWVDVNQYTNIQDEKIKEDSIKYALLRFYELVKYDTGIQNYYCTIGIDWNSIRDARNGIAHTSHVKKSTIDNFREVFLGTDSTYYLFSNFTNYTIDKYDNFELEHSQGFNVVKVEE